ncbi:hypothetical protein JFU49_16455 [Pseudomonas sp. TH03]|uniref:hypothetical protein n=1 Tax=Pseudomonas sp. TH03 TaxID=2796369 RepID=UPI001912F27C|nr:hypothetical protein [Pseudomonas sp. TH03]MBK5551854.1 hypothetical protein [Pseudomonas sp. TH03]
MESATQKLIKHQLEEIQKQLEIQCQGHEQLAVLAIVRALEVSAGIGLSDSTINNIRLSEERFYAAYGATSALKPLLYKIKNLPGPIPWMPESTEFSKFVYSYLITCGKLSYLYRLASLERFGLSRTDLTDNGALIEIQSSAVELAQIAAMKLTKKKPIPKIQNGELLKRQNKILNKKMMIYVDTANEWFIRYDNDTSIVSTYRKKAKEYAAQFIEGEALPDHCIIGDRSFKEWKKACEYALGRILCHIDFAKALKRKNRNIILGNINTIYARKEDIEAVWIESGLAPDKVKTTMDALTLRADDLDAWDKDFETPSPFYIEYGNDHLLIPCFGSIANPYYALFRHLRSTYTLDWDKAVDQREEVFRNDLSKAFPNSHYFIPKTGFKLRRENNSVLTDVDAVIIDRHSGAIALVQLKWHDVFGRSLSQRESRRRNILTANIWVERVHSWINGRSSKDILLQLGISNVTASTNPPNLYVIARYTARFSGELSQDKRSAWIGWHEILMLSKHIAKKNRIPNYPKTNEQFQSLFQNHPVLDKTFTFKNFAIKLKQLN